MSLPSKVSGKIAWIFLKILIVKKKYTGQSVRWQELYLA